MKRKLLASFLIGLLLLGLARVASASLIEWKYDATFSAVSSDPLGINGESFSLRLVFDDTDTWAAHPVDAVLINFPTILTDVSISGGHSIALNTTSPVATQSSLFAGILEHDSTNGYLDFIINGNTTTMHHLVGNFSVDASIGDNLLVGHLPYTLNSSNGTAYLDQDVADYLHISRNITIKTVDPVPEPATMLLLGTGLVGIAGAARRKKRNQA